VIIDRLTARVLLALAGLHVAWGMGSAVPFDDRDDLAEAVIGRRSVPAPAACYAVAAALGVSSCLVADVLPVAVRVRRTGLLGLGGVLGLRGTLGLIGRTDIVSPGSVSERFRRLDRRVYSPLCLLLATGAFVARAGAGVMQS
jgi:hypothetical protein